MTNTPAAHAIEVVNLSKSFGSVRAVDNANFNVPFGAVTGFVGANGSGKTTTMRMIVGLTQPTSGCAKINGYPYSQLTNPRHHVGVALDRLGAHPGISACTHLQWVAAGAGIATDRVDVVLDAVGLAPVRKRKISSYSTGMKQRLALATALLADPQILILDEPASGLDLNGVRWLRDLLRRQADAGAAVFVSTHQLAELSSIVDHIVLLERGMVVADEPVEDLLACTGVTLLEDAVLDRTSNHQTSPEGAEWLVR